jgi:hypothetical protein
LVAMNDQQSLTQADAELIRTRSDLMKAVRLLDAVIEAHADVSEAGSWSGAGNGSVSGGKGSFEPSDRTGDVATSVAHQYMRRQAGLIAKRAPELRRAMKPVMRVLDDMEKITKRAVLIALDPQLRENLARADEADTDYRRRHSHKS